MDPCSRRLRCYAPRHDGREKIFPIVTLTGICTVHGVKGVEARVQAKLALLQLAGTSRLATWTLVSVRPALQWQTTRPAARQSHALCYLSTCCRANHIIRPGPTMHTCTAWHRAWPICMRAAFTSRTGTPGREVERARYWLVADCRTSQSDVAVLCAHSIAS